MQRIVMWCGNGSKPTVKYSSRGEGGVQIRLTFSGLGVREGVVCNSGRSDERGGGGGVRV